MLEMKSQKARVDRIPGGRGRTGVGGGQSSDDHCMLIMGTKKEPAEWSSQRWREQKNMEELLAERNSFYWFLIF